MSAERPPWADPDEAEYESRADVVPAPARPTRPGPTDRSRAAVARHAFRTYGAHLAWCLHRDWPPGTCDCGYEAAWDAVLGDEAGSRTDG